VRRLILLFAAVAAAVIAVVAAGSGSAARSRTDAHAVSTPIVPVTFTDAAGDNGSAADISQVIVTNDVAGQYTFDIKLGSALAGQDEVGVLIDSDRNPATGDTTDGGTEYILGHDEGAHQYFFEQWNGSGYDAAAASSTVHVRRVSDTEVSLSVNKSELGGTGDFNFWASSWDGAGNAASDYDIAPETSAWEYKQQPRLTLTMQSGHESVAKAGGDWTLSLVVDRSDNGTTVGAEGTIACHATGGGRALAVAQKAFVSAGGGGANAARCAFVVPKALKKKLVHGTISVSYGGLTVMRAFSTRVG
jgi:hypothetical protein